MITVYWTVPQHYDFIGLRQPVPYPLLPKFVKDKNLAVPGLEYNRCPAFRQSLDNVFVGTSSVAVSFGYKFNQIHCDQDSQAAVEKFVQIRSLEERAFLLNSKHLFFTEEDSLEVTLTGAYLEDDNFNNNITVIPGTYDIGKWFRPVECSFYVKQGDRTLAVQEHTPIYYLRFNTQQKIQFKRFVCTPEIQAYANTILNSRNFNNGKIKSMNWFYDIFSIQKNLKKLLVKKIKDNIID